MLKELDIKLLYCQNCGALYKEINQIIPKDSKILFYLSELSNVSHYTERESWMSKHAPSGAICGKCAK